MAIYKDFEKTCLDCQKKSSSFQDFIVVKAPHTKSIEFFSHFCFPLGGTLGVGNLKNMPILPILLVIIENTTFKGFGEELNL